MKEIYRSFAGKLSPDNTDGYIIYDAGSGLLEIESVSVRPDVAKSRIRVPAELLPASAFADVARIGELTIDADNGCYSRGQTFFRGKWFSGDKIAEIQRANRDQNWKKYV